MEKKYNFNQIYLRENNLTPEIKQIIINEMRTTGIGTASQALLSLVKKTPDFLAQIPDLKNNLALEREENSRLRNELEEIKFIVKSYFESEKKLRNLKDYC